jgi:hypothetical protein
MLLSGCQMNDGKKFSDNAEELRRIVELDIDSIAVRWEIFGTPEHLGGVPAPTDFVTLVAEIPTLSEAEFMERAKSGTIWIAPEASRPWLAENFRSMLSKHRNAAVDLSGHYNCRAAHGKLKNSARQVNGFICNGPAKGLIYLTLAGVPEI